MPTLTHTYSIRRPFLSLVIAILAIGFIGLTTITGFADGCSGANFKGGRNFVVGQYPYSLVTADFNNDGKADIAAADYYGNSVRVVFGDGVGGFSSISTFATGLKSLAVVTGDLNNDGKPDLVGSNFDSNNISVLLNNGSSSFVVTNYAAGVGPGELALADFNDDGKLDVAVTNEGSDAIVIFPNDGGGGLLPLSLVALTPFSGPKDIVSADFNNDGKADLATANTAGSFTVVLRNGPISFNLPTTKLVVNGDLQSVAVGDFTGDYKLDLVVVSFGGSIYPLPGDGAGGFTTDARYSFSAGGKSVNVYLKDMNADGKLDMVLPIYVNLLGNSMTRVLYGNGLGGVSQTRDVLLGASSRSLALTDLNGDGKLDVVTNFVTFLNAGLSVSLNDGTGQLETATAIDTSSSDAGSLKVVDLNHDGRPDLTWTAGNTLRVRLGLPNGELAPLTPNNSTGANDLDVGDFNRDGNLDIATSNGPANSVTVHLNNGSGGFQNIALYNIGSSAKGIVVGDYDNDGKLDLVVAGNSVGSVRILKGDGLGNFLFTGATPVNANPATIVSGDFNNDGNLDVVTANECIGGNCTAKLITFFPGNGNSGFGPPVDLTSQSAPAGGATSVIYPGFIATSDFNGDGRLDLAWARGNPGSSLSTLQVALNAGGGTFATPISLADSRDNNAITAGDVNNDGRPDIAGASRYGEIQVFLNNGPATFAPPVNYSGVKTPSSVTIGDINNDGKRDIVFAQSVQTSTGGVWRLLNKCALSRGAHTSDFDGDGFTDISVFRPSTGTWYLLYSSNGSFHAIPFGSMGDVPVVGDYDGDGKSDVAVFRPANGVWYYLNSSDGSFHYQQFGANGDIPVPGDYDGDGLTNFAVWRPTTGYWYTSLNPTTNYGAVLWGQLNDKPVQADYDGDGRTDVAMFRPATAYWYILRSSLGYQEQQFGIANDIPVPADFDNDGRANFAVFRNATGWWYTSLNLVTNYGGVQLGQSGDIPAPGFYDADGRADAAVFRLGDWYVYQSNTGSVAGTHFGTSGDEAAPSAIRHP